MKEPWLDLGTRAVPASSVESLDLSLLEEGRISVLLRDGTSVALSGAPALDAVFRLSPRSFEGRRMRWPRRAWALHNLAETKSGDEQVSVEFRLPDGNLATARYGFKTDKQFAFTMSQLRALGWAGRDFTKLDFDTSALHTVVVKHTVSDRDGQTYADVTVRTGGVEKYALDQDKARAFAARMAAKVSAYDAQNGAPAQTSGPRASVAQPARTPSSHGATPRTNAAPNGFKRNPATAGAWDGQGPDPDDIPF